MSTPPPSPSSLHVEGADTTGVGPTCRGWKQVRLIRTFLILLLPCAVLSFASGALFLALARTPPETVDDVHFWFYFFDVGREINIPTWYSSIMWSVAGLLGGYFAAKAPRFRLSWALFASICVLLSLDEMLELHERLDVIGAEMSRYLPLDLHFVWVIPGALITAVLVALLLRMVLSLPAGVRNGLILAGIVFVGGGFGVETLSGLELANNGFDSAFFVLTLIEETLEMSALTLCIASLLHLIEYRAGEEGTTYRVAGKAHASAPDHRPPR